MRCAGKGSRLDHDRFRSLKALLQALSGGEQADVGTLEQAVNNGIAELVSYLTRLPEVVRRDSERGR